MWSNIEALAIYLVALLVTIQTLHWLLTRFNLISKLRPNNKEDLRGEDYKQVLDGISHYPLTNTAAHSTPACEIETTAVCTEVASQVEGIEAGVQSVVEVVGEHLASAIEGLSS